MLASLLPGLRELRAPLAAGYLWLVFGWLALSSVIPSEEAATGALARLYDLRSTVTPVGTGIVLSFLAYLLGALSEALTGPADRWLDRPFISGRARSSIELVVEERSRELASKISPDRVQSLLQEQLRTEFTLREAGPVVRLGELLLMIDQRIVDELDLAATRLIGDEPELFSTVDRLRAEAEFRIAIAPPLLALALYLGVTEHAAWLTGTIPVAVLVWQGIRRRIEANDVVADAILLGRVEAPILERVRRAADLPDRAAEEAEPTPTQESESLTAEARGR